MDWGLLYSVITSPEARIAYLLGLGSAFLGVGITTIRYFFFKSVRHFFTEALSLTHYFLYGSAGWYFVYYFIREYIWK